MAARNTSTRADAKPVHKSETGSGWASATLLVLILALAASMAVIYRLARSQRRKKPSPLIQTTDGSLFRARVQYISDGDTFLVNRGGEEIWIRLANVDCPEGDQPWGDIALAGLIKLIGGKDVLLEVHDLDIYKRTVATVYTENSGDFINVCERMVMLGHAWVERRFYHQVPERRQAQLDRLESWAKQKRVGLWNCENPIAPWVWRERENADSTPSFSDRPRIQPKKKIFRKAQ
ncbi:MAG: thermonuclease family protein [Bdellovibrionales bacterium]|nr:thermonuclease family protein [Bdellovibrionales bacterium]